MNENETTKPEVYEPSEECKADCKEMFDRFVTLLDAVNSMRWR